VSSTSNFLLLNHRITPNLSATQPLNESRSTEPPQKVVPTPETRQLISSSLTASTIPQMEPLTQIILLSIRRGPAPHKPRRSRDATLAIILHSPEREIAPDIRAHGGEHARPLAPARFKSSGLALLSSPFPKFPSNRGKVASILTHWHKSPTSSPSPL